MFVLAENLQGYEYFSVAVAENLQGYDFKCDIVASHTLPSTWRLAPRIPILELMLPIQERIFQVHQSMHCNKNRYVCPVGQPPTVREEAGLIPQPPRTNTYTSTKYYTCTRNKECDADIHKNVCFPFPNCSQLKDASPITLMANADHAVTATTNMMYSLVYN